MDNRHNRKLFENALQEVQKKSEPKQLNEVIGTLIGLGILGGAAYKVAKDWKAEKKARQEESETKALERRALLSKIEEPERHRAFTAQQNELGRQADAAKLTAQQQFGTSERVAGEMFKSGESKADREAADARLAAQQQFGTSERVAGENFKAKQGTIERKFKRGEGNKARRERGSIRRAEAKKAADEAAAKGAADKTRRQQAAITAGTRRITARAAAELNNARAAQIRSQTEDPANKDENLSLISAQLASQGKTSSEIMRRLDTLAVGSLSAATPAPAPAPAATAPSRRRATKKPSAPPAPAATPSPAPAPPRSTKKKISDEPTAKELARIESEKAAIRAENSRKTGSKPKNTPVGFDPDADEDNY